MAKSNHIKFLNDIKGGDAKYAGGKGANLGELTSAGIPVPPGFVVLVSALQAVFVAAVGKKIQTVMGKINTKEAASVKNISDSIKKIIAATRLPQDLEKEIIAAFDALGAVRVAVRSSASAEDSKSDSWAGQLESNLNIGKEDLIRNIKKSWASLYGERALLYAAEAKQRKSGSVAVVVQKMSYPEASGVCFTAHPVTKNKKQIIIEAVWGLGESLVQGAITPDRYTINRSDFSIADIDANDQEKLIVQAVNGVKWAKVPASKVSAQKLPGKEIVELARLCVKIERLYKTPQDIEWAYERGKFFILQTRPITTL